MGEKQVNNVSLPTMQEGRQACRFSGSSAEATTVLSTWKNQVHARAKVENFRASDSVKLQLRQWQKFRDNIGKIQEQPEPEKDEEEIKIEPKVEEKPKPTGKHH